MKEFLLDLFLYNNHYNIKIISVVDAQPVGATTRCLSLLSHILNSHRIWNYRIKSVHGAFMPWDLHSVQEVTDINRQNHDDSLDIINTMELSKSIRWSTLSGQGFSNSVLDILFQIVNHSTYHRGQIATEFRKIGIEPILTDYIAYKMT